MLLENYIFCEYQSFDTYGNKICLAHLHESRVLRCPYSDVADRLRAEYPCSDYIPDNHRKELGL